MNRTPEAHYQIPFFRGLGEVLSMQNACATCSATFLCPSLNFSSSAFQYPATALPNIKSKPVLAFQAVLQLPHSSTCQAHACVREKKCPDFCNCGCVIQAKSQCEISLKEEVVPKLHQRRSKQKLLQSVLWSGVSLLAYIRNKKNTGDAESRQLYSY